MGASREEIDAHMGTGSDSVMLRQIAENEKQHRVVLSSFLVAKYEVTQEAWSDLMGNLPHLIKDTSCSMGPRFPVEFITREEAERFCEKYGFALPSEAQWEYACRGGSASTFAGTGVLDDMGWYYRNAGTRSRPVGTKQPNAFGLHDMHGNVEEFCRDSFAPFYGFPEAAGPDPVCTSGALSTYVKRGGSYNQHAHNCRSASRSNEGPSSQGSSATGVRPVFLLR
jgi:formylglycine-generating enzyme required for sulfatase activity